MISLPSPILCLETIVERNISLTSSDRPLWVLLGPKLQNRSLGLAECTACFGQRAFKPVLSKQLAGCNNLGQADPRVRVAMRRRGRWIRDWSAGGFITHLAPQCLAQNPATQFGPLSHQSSGTAPLIIIIVKESQA